jgi:antitoxin VapB
LKLASQFSFPGAQVFVHRDPSGGDVLLSAKPASWQEFFEIADPTPIPSDFMADRKYLPAQERDLF